MRILLIHFFVLMCLSAFSQTLVENGFQQFYYENGQLSSEGMMRDGKPDGYWKTYYENGTLKSEGNRVDFELDSTWKFFNEQGQLVSEINYKQGKKNGIRTLYQEDEIIKETFVNDVKQGFSWVYYPNQKVKLKIPFEAGLENGIAREYDLTGRIIQLIYYDRGFITERERINRLDADSLKHGVWKWFWEDETTLKEEGTYKHGLKHGYFKTFNRDGNLESAFKYVDGVKQEKVEEFTKLEVKTEYYPDGSPKIVATYKDGKPEGIMRKYDETGEVTQATLYKNGVIVGEGIISNAGLKQGPWKEYYPDGKLKANGYYRDNLRVGDWKFYHRNGAIEQSGSYNEEGLYEGVWLWYYETGDLLREENFLNGLSDGMMVEYDPDGNVITKGEYFEGREEGLWLIDMGDHREEGSFVDGKKDGMWSYYYPDGKLSFKGKFVEDNPNGKHKWYWDNGQLKQEGLYQMGRKDGSWKKFDANGLLLFTIEYSNGVEKKYDGIQVESKHLYVGNDE